ncbi:hypothetical protein F5Y10DRAFT_282351 [Nemania abortiva]|nr:hypothetical protein F5Y10DRAFT_282351 [Nemania abortiva]
MHATNFSTVSQDGHTGGGVHAGHQDHFMQWSEQEYGGLEVDHDRAAGMEVYNQSCPEVNQSRTSESTKQDPREPPHVRPHSIDSPRKQRVCGLRRKRFYILGVILVLVVVGIGVGVGVGASRGHLTRTEGVDGQSNTSPILQNSSIAAAQWRDISGTKEYRLYVQSKQGPVLEASWSSSNPMWKLSRITNVSADIMLGTPIAVSVGYPNASSKYTIAENVYFLNQEGTVVQHQSPWRGQWDDWRDSSLGTVSDGSSLLSFWDQDLDTQAQTRVIIFQDLGNNSLCITKYSSNKTSASGWSPKEQFPLVQSGSALAVAPIGSIRTNLRLYMVDAGGTMRVYRYNLTNDTLYDSISTTFNLPPHATLSISTQDNRDYFTKDTLPECARGDDQPLTHLIMFPTLDRSSLNLISWNCSSGFVNQTMRIQSLLQANRTYLGLTSTVSSLHLNDQRVYVLFDAGDGPEIEEWQVPPGAQNANWKILGRVPTTLT